MKHYHNKDNLSECDVLYFIVKKGDMYEFDFKNVDESYNETLIKQGIKLWLNRVTIRVQNQKVDELIPIFWYQTEPNKTREANRHIHFYGTKFTFEVIDTIDEKPNIGVLNVWTFDNQRCYELTNNSWIKESKPIVRLKKREKTIIASHGWNTYSSPTIELKIIKMAQSNGEHPQSL